MSEFNISSSEWEIMRVVWAHEPLSSRDIIDLAKQSLDWQEGTIKSLLSRLVAKGILNKDTQTKPFIFTSAVSSQRANHNKITTLFDQVCTKERGDYLEKLITEQPLSKEHIEKMIRLLKDRHQDAPDIVECQCSVGQCKCHIQHH